MENVFHFSAGIVELLSRVVVSMVILMCILPSPGLVIIDFFILPTTRFKSKLYSLDFQTRGWESKKSFIFVEKQKYFSFVNLCNVKSE